MYFEQMLFLIPQTQDRATFSNYSPMTVSNGEEDTDERREDEEGSNDGTAETYTSRKKIEREEFYIWVFFETEQVKPFENRSNVLR
jgi:hypothetical protein